jgi:hypothetical protein
MAPEELLKKIASILEELKIPYAVTGGFAVSVWGRPRYTADIDIIVELLEKNIKPLAKKLLEIEKNVYVDEDMIREALLYSSEFNFIEPDFGLKVDFFVKDSTPYNKLKIKRRIKQDIFGQNIFFVSPEDLILSKLLWGKESESFKQQADVKTILENKKLKLDFEYLKNWAKKQGTIEMLEKLIEKNNLCER